MPTPRDPADRLFAGKPTPVNIRKLQNPTPNNYGQPVETGSGAGTSGPGFVQGSGTPSSQRPPRWVKIGHLSQGRGGGQKTTPGILGPRPGFR